MITFLLNCTIIVNNNNFETKRVLKKKLIVNDRSEWQLGKRITENKSTQTMLYTNYIIFLSLCISLFSKENYCIVIYVFVNLFMKFINKIKKFAIVIKQKITQGIIEQRGLREILHTILFCCTSYTNTLTFNI